GSARRATLPWPPMIMMFSVIWNPFRLDAFTHLNANGWADVPGTRWLLVQDSSASSTPMLLAAHACSEMSHGEKRILAT
ncbi:hypothetical protein, partial [Cutibacterium granulosum]|uniref:hypothetical protein n=1 Tax=Cutibacterium granulosum TaxID=33011 RepID=UPI002B237EA5